MKPFGAGAIVGIGAQQGLAGVEQFGKIGFEAPSFAVGSASEFRRIENDPVIAAATTDFALHEAERVVANPADRRFA
jgi:hypothetical protein